MMDRIMTGDELKKLRSEYDVTQSELASYLGYISNGKPNRSMIARFENNHAVINPRISRLIQNYFMEFNRVEEFDHEPQ